jgi:hypothetical protein
VRKENRSWGKPSNEETGTQSSILTCTEQEGLYALPRPAGLARPISLNVMMGRVGVGSRI